jgi:hypothetical protein
MTRKMYAPIVSERLPLREWDEDDWVQFQRPDRLTEEQIARVQAQYETIFDDVARTRIIRNRPAIAEQESEMVACCLVGCSVQHAESGTAVFTPGVNCRKFGMEESSTVRHAFYQTWYRLDPELAEAIIAELREWHPPFNLWGAPPPRSRESETNSTPGSEPISETTNNGGSSTTNGSESTE